MTAVINTGSVLREISAISLANCYEDLGAAADEAFVDREEMSLSEWADTYRILPASTSAEPGPFRTSRLPYLKAIMDALSNPRVRKVVVAKGSQVGASTVGENWIGYSMHRDQASMLALWPNKDLLKRWSLTRLDPLIEETPVINRLFARNGMRDSNDSLAHKDVPGMSFDAVTAQSTAALKSISAPRLIVEEVDEIPSNIGEQGDPIELMRRALRTFWNAKTYMVSTPVKHGKSRIWEQLRDSTWCEWWLPCPHCKEFQVLRWRDGHKDEDDASGKYRFIYEKDARGAPIPGTVTYTCVHNGCVVEESAKEWMNARGEWRARNPEHTTLGFHLPAFFSPLIQWDVMAADFHQGLKDSTKMKVVVNTHFGLPYRDKGDSLSPHFLMQRAHPYEAEVPDGVRLITVSADVQGAGDGSVHIGWIGWGAGLEKWVLKWEIVSMEDLPRQTWPALLRAVGERMSHALIDRRGARRFPVAGVIDGRFQTAEIIKWTNRFRLPNGRRVLAIAGVQGRSRPVLESEQQQQTKRRRSRARRPLRTAAVDIVKDLMATDLRIEKPGPGYVHHPDTMNPSWYDGLTAEEATPEYKNGEWYRKWEKRAADLMNEPWDLLVYGYIALHSLGPKVMADLETMGIAVEAIADVDATETPAPRRRAKKRRAPINSTGVV